MARFLARHPEYRKLGLARRCEWCEEAYQPVAGHQRYCGEACSRAAERWRRGLASQDRQATREQEEAALIEARYATALKAIKAERRHLTEEAIWAQPMAWHEHLEKTAPDVSDLYYLSPAASKTGTPRGRARAHEPARAAR